MKTPHNPFKQALIQKQAQIGCWVGLPDAYSTEICAGAGFDWLLLDGDHAPNDIPRWLALAQAVAAYPGTHAIARVPMGHGHVGEMLIKQYLDIGIQTLLVPMVDTAEQAAAIVKACRYPQDDGKGGIRGMAGARASRWGRYPNYAKEANAQVCLLVQAETTEALKNLKAIAATEGVDGVFIGPADLSASMGYRGQPAHPEVVKTIMEGVATVRAAGKAAGILMADQKMAHMYLEAGAQFVAVGVDTTLLVRTATELAAAFKGPRGNVTDNSPKVY